MLNGEEVKAKKGEIAREVCDDLKFLMEKMLKKDYKERISWTELIETNIMKSEYSIERMSLFSNKTNIIKY